MRRLALVLLFTASAAVPARGADIGAFVPLTNTQYAPVSADLATLATDGSDPFLFFSSRNTLRMARVGEGTQNVGRVILEETSSKPAVVWTGGHFVVASSVRNRGLALAVVERDGTPARPPIMIATDDVIGVPEMAFNGKLILLVYVSGYSGFKAAVLDREGTVLHQNLLHYSSPYSAAVASNGDGFVAVFDDRRHRYVYRFDAAGEQTEPPVRTIYGSDWGPTALVSNGRDYLLLVHEPVTGAIKAVAIPANGKIGAAVNAERSAGTSRLGALSATWRGDAYVVAFQKSGSNELATFTVDASGNPLTPHEVIHAVNQSFPGNLVSLRGRSYVCWTVTGDRTAAVREIGSNDEGWLASYGAADQALEATAASSAGTLFVWRERGILHSGFRTTTGEWVSEQSIGIDLSQITLTSNGTEFLLLGQGLSRTWLALRLSRTGRVVGQTVPVSTPDLIGGAAWNGRHYVVAGTKWNGEVVAFTIDAGTGSVGPARTVSCCAWRAPAVASDGTTVMVTWIAGSSLLAARLGPALQVLDNVALTIGTASSGSDSSAQTRLIAAGDHFLSAWRVSMSDVIHIARIDASGRLLGPEVHVRPYDPASTYKWASTADLTILGVEDSVAVLWRDESQYERVRTHFRLVHNTRVVSEATWDSLPQSGRARPVRVGRHAAVAISRVNNTAPHHGALRVMLAAAAASDPLPDLPNAPRLVARPAEGDEVRLSWVAGIGSRNGFRIESRVEDGAWKEVARWYGAQETSATVHLARPGARTWFRIRAWNDGGVSAYSNEALVTIPRRRAVR